MRNRALPHSLLGVLATVGTAVVAGACDGSPVEPADSPSVAIAPSFDKGGTQDHFNEKFEFTGVALPDGTTGTIRAGSKKNNNGQDTNCGYYTSEDAFLGLFDTQAFASADAEAVRTFCLDHYDDRTTD